jgi:SAM-dependent methyltransferase
MDKKHRHELGYWLGRFKAENRNFRNAHYRELMLGIAQEGDDNFLKGKIVADFGCGPRGSLAWTGTPARRIGIDVLVPVYLEFFSKCMLSHEMDYITSTERIIPLPSASIDVLFSINSLDHVHNLDNMASEMLRILKPDGLFLASFNLNEPASCAEPQCLDEELLKKCLFKFLDMKSYRIALKDEQDTYKNLHYNSLLKGNMPEKRVILWISAIKK